MKKFKLKVFTHINIFVVGWCTRTVDRSPARFQYIMVRIEFREGIGVET